MKLNIVTTTAILAIAGALMIQSAKAQYVGTSGDLILSFNDTHNGDSGTSTNFQVDLGQFSLYSNATVDITNIATDLSAIYGSNWYSNANLTFGIDGAVNNGDLNGVLNSSVLVSNKSTTPLAGNNLTTLGGSVSQIIKLYTPSSDATNVPTDGAAANSYRVKTASGASFQKVSVNDGYSIGTIGSKFNGSTDPALYVDVVQPDAGGDPFANGTVTQLGSGYFSISSTGEVTYQAVPEPSTYALLICGGVLLLVVLKRRQSVSSL